MTKFASAVARSSPLVPTQQGGLAARQEVGDLGDLVDDAAGRAAAEGQRRRTLQDFDAVDVEEVAVVLANVAHGIEEEIAARGKAPQPEDLRSGHAAFRRGERDARARCAALPAAT